MLMAGEAAGRIQIVPWFALLCRLDTVNVFFQAIAVKTAPYRSIMDAISASN